MGNHLRGKLSYNVFLILSLFACSSGNLKSDSVDLMPKTARSAEELHSKIPKGTMLGMIDEVDTPGAEPKPQKFQLVILFEHQGKNPALHLYLYEKTNEIRTRIYDAPLSFADGLCTGKDCQVSLTTGVEHRFGIVYNHFTDPNYSSQLEFQWSGTDYQFLARESELPKILSAKNKFYYSPCASSFFYEQGLRNDSIGEKSNLTQLKHSEKKYLKRDSIGFEKPILPESCAVL